MFDSFKLRSVKRLLAVGAAGLVAFGLGACGKSAPADTPESAAGAQSPGNSSAAKTSEEIPAGDVSPADAALMYVRAVQGDPKQWDAYAPEAPIESYAAKEVDTTIEAWEFFEFYASPEQKKQFEQAMTDALMRAEVSVVDEKIDGDSAAVTLAIRGVNETKGSEIWTEKTDLAALVSQDQGEMIFQNAVGKWENAPLAEKSSDFTFEMEKDADGRWVPAAGTYATEVKIFMYLRDMQDYL